MVNVKVFLTLALAAAIVAPASAQVVPHPVPYVLPKPPTPGGTTSNLLFDASLAISRAQQRNPQAAQNAIFSYQTAIDQYRSGDLIGARQSALQAQAQASMPAAQNGNPAAAANAPAVPPSIIAPGRQQLPETEGGPYGSDAAVVDADTFLALARGSLDACRAQHDPRTAAATTSYERAARAFASRNYEATRLNAKAAIDACAAARRRG